MRGIVLTIMVSHFVFSLLYNQISFMGFGELTPVADSFSLCSEASGGSRSTFALHYPSIYMGYNPDSPRHFQILLSVFFLFQFGSRL